MPSPATPIELATLNVALEPEDRRHTDRFDAPRYPVTFVVALPRAASTLFQQILASTTDIGYVSNLLARFWQAPSHGAALARSLRDPHFVSNFRSMYGNTTGPLEPAEWGWFWQRWLRLDGNEHYVQRGKPPDLAGLARTLAAVENAFGAPLIFDNVFALANLDVLRRALPNVLAAYVRRDSRAVCKSILNARLERYGSLHAFYGHRPRTMDDLLRVADPVEQVVLQVKAIQAEIDETLRGFPPGSVFTADYADLVSAPGLVAERFAAFMAGHDVPLSLRPAPLPALRSRDGRGLVDDTLAARLDDLHRRHFGDAL